MNRSSEAKPDDDNDLVQCSRCGRIVFRGLTTTDYTGYAHLCIACVIYLGRDKNRPNDERRAY